MKSKSGQFNSMLIYFLMYVPLGAVCTLISQYLSSIGFTGTQVGTVTSVATGAAVVGGLIMGRIYANAGNKRLVISIMFIAAAVGSVTAMSIKAFFGFVLIYAFMYFFQGPVHGLCDSMVIQNDQNFPLIRAFGAIGYAVASYFAGLMSESKGLRVIFIIHAVSFALAAVAIFAAKEPPHHTEKQEKISMRVLFKDKQFVRLLICSFFCLGTVMSNNTYFGYIYRAAGGEVSGIGFCFLLMCIAEAVFMAILPAIKRRVKTEQLLPVGIGVCALRFALYAIFPTTGVLIGTFFLQGIQNGIILVEIVKYFEMAVEPKHANISVSTYYALGNNLPAILMNFLSGVILDALGIRAVYATYVIFNVIALALYFVFGLHRECERYG